MCQTWTGWVLFNRRIVLCLSIKWYVRTCLDSLLWCMFIQSAVYWTLAVTGDLIAGSHQPSSCLYDCVGVWRLQFHSDPPPRGTTFTVISPCVYMWSWMCVWPIWTSKMSVCIFTGVWLMCCESCKEGWLRVRRHKQDIRNHSRQEEEREEGQERISTWSYSCSFGLGCLINSNNYCKNMTPLAKWLEESKTYL